MQLLRHQLQRVGLEGVLGRLMNTTFTRAGLPDAPRPPRRLPHHVDRCNQFRTRPEVWKSMRSRPVCTSRGWQIITSDALLDPVRHPRLPLVRRHRVGLHHRHAEPVPGEDVLHPLGDVPVCPCAWRRPAPCGPASVPPPPGPPAPSPWGTASPPMRGGTCTITSRAPGVEDRLPPWCSPRGRRGGFAGRSPGAASSRP